jgi:hypothetical protein
VKLAVPLIRLFECPVDEIEAALPPASSAIWEIDRSRQSTYPVHRATRSILFEWLDNDWQVGSPAVVKRHDYAPPALAEAAYACAARMAPSYPGAKLVRMTLAEMPPHTRIPAHVDNGIGVTAMHRCHLPIVTSGHVHFHIDRISHYLERGVVYEFDNTRLHAVDNQSGERRVHLLCDFLPAALVV